jgi:hypothetical protein
MLMSRRFFMRRLCYTQDANPLVFDFDFFGCRRLGGRRNNTKTNGNEQIGFAQHSETEIAEFRRFAVHDIGDP